LDRGILGQELERGIVVERGIVKRGTVSEGASGGECVELKDPAR
jgi:hypothetical protein